MGRWKVTALVAAALTAQPGWRRSPARRRRAAASSRPASTRAPGSSASSRPRGSAGAPSASCAGTPGAGRTLAGPTGRAGTDGAKGDAGPPGRSARGTGRCSGSTRCERRGEARPVKQDYRVRRGRRATPAPGSPRSRPRRPRLPPQAARPERSTATWDASRHAVFTCGTTGPPPPPPTGGVRVNEVMTGDTGAAADEFVELYNAGSTPAQRSAKQAVYRSAAGTSDVTLVTIPDVRRWRRPRSCSPEGAATRHHRRPDISFSTGLARRQRRRPLGGRRARRLRRLRRDDRRARRGAPPAAAPAAGQSIERTPDGDDTNANAADFGITRQPDARSVERLIPLRGRAAAAARPRNQTRRTSAFVDESCVSSGSSFAWISA